MNNCVFCDQPIKESDSIVTLRKKTGEHKINSEVIFHAECYEKSIKNRTTQEAVVILNKYKDTAINLFQILKDNEMARQVILNMFHPKSEEFPVLDESIFSNIASDESKDKKQKSKKEDDNKKRRKTKGRKRTDKKS